MAYVALLILLAIISTLGFAFLFKVGIETSATETRGTSMQAHYLAESAANHAMWRLLNETTSQMNFPVCHIDDDAEERDSGSMASGPDIKNMSLGQRRYVGLRFANIQVPQGASITNAYVAFTARDDDNRQTDVTVFGEDTDDASPFTTADFNISSRTMTSAVIAWNNIREWIGEKLYITPDITAIIQEIVNRPGWSTGNAMAILIRSEDLDGKRVAYAYDSDPASAAVLHIQYGDASVAAGGKYYMHSLAGGRYGYKIRRHTDTTFATIATVGAVGENVVHQSYVLHIKPPLATGCPKNLLFVVDDSLNLTSTETARKTLMEGWGATVTTISDNASEVEFVAGMAAVDVIYISQEITSLTLPSKLRDTPIGIVNEEYQISDELGISSGNGAGFYNDMNLVDNTHYITSGFSLGALALFSPTYTIYTGAAWTLAPDLKVLGQCGSMSVLVTLETGGALYGGGTASARRVQVPWGADFSALNADGQTLMMRAIEWAAGMEGGCDQSICPGLVGYWELDETADITAADSSGLGNDGTLTNMDPSTDWVSGNIAGALDFDGVDDHVLVPHGDSLSLTTFSISAWIRPSVLSGWQIVACKGTSTTAINYYLGTKNDEIVIGFYNGAWTEFETANVNLSTNQWYHIAGTFDHLTGDANIYINGAPGLNGSTATSPAPNSDDLTIGRDPFGEYWSGRLDDLRIYNRVLSPDEIAQLHAMNVGGCGMKLLYVVKDPGNLTPQETARKTLMESWSFTVQLIDDDDTQANFDSAAAANQVAYISQEALATSVGAKLTHFTIGVVNENKDMIDDLGFATGLSMGGGVPTMNVKLGHYITSVFATNPVSPYIANEWYQIVNEPVAAGVDPVGKWAEAPWTGKPALMALCQGDSLIGGGTADGRRVQIPWGSGQGATPVDIYNSISNNGRTIMRRAIGWAAGIGECGVDGIVFEEFTEGTEPGGGTSVTIDKPGGTAQGDLLVAAVATDGNMSMTLSPPAGWNLINIEQSSNAMTFGVWWKLAGASESSTYTFTWSGIQEAYGWIMRFTGHDPADPIDTWSADSGTGSSPTSTPVITSVDNAMVLRMGGFDDDDITVDSPGLSGHTAITMDKSSTGNGTASGGAGYVIQPTAGNSGTSTFSLTGSEDYRTVTISIAPDPG